MLEIMYLLKEPLFCEQLARFARPKIFKSDWISERGWNGQTKYEGVIESRVELWTPPPNIQAQITITNKYAKMYKSEISLTGWKELNQEEKKKLVSGELTRTVYTFNVISRVNLKVTIDRLEKSLAHYKEHEANLLFVKSLQVGDLSPDQVRNVVSGCGYDLVVWDLVLR